MLACVLVQSIYNCSQRVTPVTSWISRSVCVQFVNKDIIPLDGPATIKAAYKLWKQTGSKQKQQPANNEKWQRLSKAETVPPKSSDTLKVHAQAASEDQV